MRLTLASTLLPAALLTGVAAAQANDECSGALPATLGSNAFDNTGATTSAPGFSCEPTQGQADIWYSFVAPATATYQVDTCGSTFDTVLEVLSGSCGSLTVENCNDDGCSVQSSLVFNGTVGATYYVRVGGWGGATGPGTFDITQVMGVPNDECATALPATAGLGVTAWDNTNATTSSPPFSCEPVQGQADVWYSWTATVSGAHIFETCGSSLADTVLEVIEGNCNGPVIACNDDGCAPFQSRTSGVVTAGTDYFIRIGGWGGATGTGTLTISLAPVVNDDCAGALPAMVGMTPFDNTNASTSSPAFSCEPVQGQSDVWFTFTAPSTTQYTIETCGSALNDTVLEVFEGSCAGPVVGCNDDFCAFTSLVVVPTTAGTEYKIRVGGWGGAEGTGTITISEFQPPTLQLAAHYKLDEPSGFLAADSSGNGNDGTYTNVVLGQPGADPNTGNSASFDGSTATVDIPASNSLDALRADLSAAAWINVDAAPSSTYRIFSNSGPSGSWSFALVPGAIAFTTHAILDYSSDPVTYVPGQWHHIAVVMSETNDVSFYFDGQPVGTDAGTSASNSPSTEYHIGAWNPNFSIPQFFDGRIDDLQVYNGQLSPADVMTLFNNPGVTVGDRSIGTNYCMANPNTTGSIGEISAEGNATASLNDVTLTASSLPTGSFGFFIVSRNQGFTANPSGSEGNLCLSGIIGRYVGPGEIMNTGNAGEFSLQIDVSQIPQATQFVSAMAGDVFNWQAWHRDQVMGASTSNFTNGIEIMFQ